MHAVSSKISIATVNVAGAVNASTGDIVVQTASQTLNVGDKVLIASVGGATNLNTYWFVAAVVDATHFKVAATLSDALLGIYAQGNDAAYTSGGTTLKLPRLHTDPAFRCSQVEVRVPLASSKSASFGDSTLASTNAGIMGQVSAGASADVNNSTWCTPMSAGNGHKPYNLFAEAATGTDIFVTCWVK